MSQGTFKLLVGLGNPGTSYIKTRHNIGFMALEKLARKNSATFKLNKRIFGQVADVGIGENKKRLLMPNTFMNNSGLSIRAAMDWFDIEINQVLILVDDIDLPLGKIRMRTRGSSGGHNGIKSIIDTLGSTDFYRLKIGIGHPVSLKTSRKTLTSSHVLGPFHSNEAATIENVLEEVIKGLDLIETQSLEIGITHLNSYKHNSEVK